MIDIKNFTNQPIEEKYKYIKEYGTFLMEQKNGNRKIFLYFFANMFCEVWIMELPDDYDRLVSDIKLFKSYDYLEPYWKAVNIDDIYY